jgi:hypothetical protein
MTSLQTRAINKLHDKVYGNKIPGISKNLLLREHQGKENTVFSSIRIKQKNNTKLLIFLKETNSIGIKQKENTILLMFVSTPRRGTILPI